MSEEKKMPNNATKEASEVALQDFTGDIQAYIDKLPMYEKAVNRKIPVASSMWTLFSAIVDTMVQDEFVKTNGDYKKETAESTEYYINAINNYVESINNQDNVEHNLLRLAFMCSLAYLRIRDYDAFFLKKEEVKSEADSTEVESETNSKE